MFCYDSKLGAKWAKLVQVMQKFVPQCRVGSFRKERTQSTPLDPELMFCCASYCLGAFGSISLLLLNSMQNGLNWCNSCKSSCHEVASEFVATNAPDPPHWTKNSCFFVFRSVWVHFGPFCYSMKLDAKWAKLVQLLQEFMPWSHIGIIRKECTRSTPMDPKLVFCCIS